jgi:uncharacterized iron-regulated membrane protein
MTCWPVRQAYPQGHDQPVPAAANAERSAQFVVHDGGRELNVFVDPYTATSSASRTASRTCKPSPAPCMAS